MGGQHADRNFVRCLSLRRGALLQRTTNIVCLVRKEACAQLIVYTLIMGFALSDRVHEIFIAYGDYTSSFILTYLVDIDWTSISEYLSLGGTIFNVVCVKAIMIFHFIIGPTFYVYLLRGNSSLAYFSSIPNRLIDYAFAMIGAAVIWAWTFIDPAPDIGPLSLWTPIIMGFLKVLAIYLVASRHR